MENLFTLEERGTENIELSKAEKDQMSRFATRWFMSVYVCSLAAIFIGALVGAQK
ncbi:hypothetical protein CANTEDRAFT_114805 [Yamadazyma tenuis ATCC 10573]|uniref:Uncharacterized protein n=1 Tax=Candida tenuis (strain ATCC 10573 / BCRC 21748 / CBS 615 / JCM 9827 / NBRC 10315 / NRRL Y-1498 / VKM Y-70) TaxID=590646 RepID=G3B6M1_CANTC|nr:uncharacterized protein CANTEDRAFT_114805 [Yamadazyma tenuis ATCC 10573]XP_006687497.1 uncharacterized protein CANTEDRAFT_114805 [Yamadazyma tenuis ATCC 10573]EGV63703.1 hypothetical protein CANTEDRAFT_114805 [Yamadazyma tenuis ATCC 10573]EGV63704.1 hypothetical protein CANTEDRAFT_114805 [Yamadazyma tenuis ATCC 10573]